MSLAWCPPIQDVLTIEWECKLVNGIVFDWMHQSSTWGTPIGFLGHQLVVPLCEYAQNLATQFVSGNWHGKGFCLRIWVIMPGDLLDQGFLKVVLGQFRSKCLTPYLPSCLSEVLVPHQNRNVILLDGLDFGRASIVQNTLPLQCQNGIVQTFLQLVESLLVPCSLLEFPHERLYGRSSGIFGELPTHVSWFYSR